MFGVRNSARSGWNDESPSSKVVSDVIAKFWFTPSTCNGRAKNPAVSDTNRVRLRPGDAK